MNIYEINDSLKNLEEALEVCEGNEEAQELIRKALEEVGGNLKEKVDNSVRFIRNKEAEAKALAEEIKFLQAKKKVVENKIDNFKKYLFEFTQSNDGKVQGDMFKLSIRKNPASLNIINEDEISDIFKTTQIVIDKTALKEALKKGGEIAGAELVQSQSLSIK